MRKFLIIIIVCLIAGAAFAGIRMSGSGFGPLGFGGGGLEFSRPSSGTDISGTYWGTAYGSLWTTAYGAQWTEAYNTEIP